MKVLESFLLFVSLGFEFTDNRAHTTDVIGKGDTAECLDKDQDDCFSGIGGADVSEPYCEHDIGPPVISPDVFGRPWLIDYIYFLVPVLAVLA